MKSRVHITGSDGKEEPSIDISYSGDKFCLTVIYDLHEVKLAGEIFVVIIAQSWS